MVKFLTSSSFSKFSHIPTIISVFISLLTTSVTSRSYGYSTPRPIFTPTTPKPSVDGPPSGGSLGLLYVFSEASKRIPFNQLPHKVESATSDFGDTFNKWCAQAVNEGEKLVLEVGGTMFDMLQVAAKDVSKKAGDMFSTSVDTIGDSIKSIVSEWIGCGRKTYSNKRPQHSFNPVPSLSDSYGDNYNDNYQDHHHNQHFQHHSQHTQQIHRPKPTQAPIPAYWPPPTSYPSWDFSFG